MRLPVIKHILQFVKENDIDYITETLEVLEHISDSSSIKDEELDVLGELISNLYGAKEVHQSMMASNLEEKEALNGFMKRVMGSIDK